MATRDAALLEGSMLSVRFAGECHGPDLLGTARCRLSNGIQTHNAVKPNCPEFEDACEPAHVNSGLA